MPLTRLGAEPQRREVPALKSSLWPSGFGGFLVFVWLVVIHLTAVLGLAMYPLPGWRLLLRFTALAFFGGCGSSKPHPRERDAKSGADGSWRC